MTQATNRQLPSSMVAKEFGEVNVRNDGRSIEADFTLLLRPEGEEAEQYQTGVALDASASMKNWYGRTLRGKLPPEVEEQYRRKGWLTQRIEDGKKVNAFQREAYEDALAQGHFRMSDNIVEPQGREFIRYLADELDADGGTTAVYWACGDGSAIEVIGDVTSAQCAQLELVGPKTAGFGAGTHLLPAVRYFVDRFRDAKRGMYLFLTDGKLDDLADVKQFTVQLAREIAAGRRNGVKCVLIGVGDKIDERQMEELDDLDTGTDVDIWDHKLAAEMRSLIEIFAEVVSENTIIPGVGHIYDANGAVVKRFTDGIPARIRVTLPANSPWFELDVNGVRIRQNLEPPKR
jgi:hypothetical protein